ncbi:MAG: hypothetical protein KGI78_00830 [Patescibacteria group bacterium]|nr:hypothetical protein [Patescibacteria group bacterium]
MIRVLDNNTLILLKKRALMVRADQQCYVPEEIEEEFKGSASNERWFKRNPFVTKRLDEARYLAIYAHFLNNYSGVSFYSLKGFGDVAILAVLSMLIAEAPPTSTLSRGLFPEHSIYVVTDDKTLITTVRNEFPVVIIESGESFAASV